MLVVFGNASDTGPAFVNVTLDGSPPQCIEGGVKPVNHSVSTYVFYVCLYHVCVCVRMCVCMYVCTLDGPLPQCIEGGVKPVNHSVSTYVFYVFLYNGCVCMYVYLSVSKVV